MAQEPVVVISEVAWGGTAASPSDEWIELRNNSTQDVWLAGWTLAAIDGRPTIPLTGTIAAGGYFLLERTADDTVLDVPADLIYTWGLHNSGETLVLTDTIGIAMDTANANGGAWPAGTDAAGSPPYASMERIDPTAPDTDGNWRTNDGLMRNGLDADGSPINGTPTGSQPPVELPRHTIYLPIMLFGW